VAEPEFTQAFLRRSIEIEKTASPTDLELLEWEESASRGKLLRRSLHLKFLFLSFIPTSGRHLFWWEMESDLLFFAHR
jgi:hypothetical protein